MKTLYLWTVIYLVTVYTVLYSPLPTVQYLGIVLWYSRSLFCPWMRLIEVEAHVDGREVGLDGWMPKLSLA